MDRSGKGAMKKEVCATRTRKRGEREERERRRSFVRGFREGKAGRGKGAPPRARILCTSLGLFLGSRRSSRLVSSRRGWMSARARARAREDRCWVGCVLIDSLLAGDGDALEVFQVPPVGFAAEDAGEDGSEEVEGEGRIEGVEGGLVVEVAPGFGEVEVGGVAEVIFGVAVAVEVVEVVVALEDFVVREEPVGGWVDVGREEGRGGFAVSLGDEVFRDVVEEGRDDEVVGGAVAEGAGRGLEAVFPEVDGLAEELALLAVEGLEEFGCDVDLRVGLPHGDVVFVAGFLKGRPRGAEGGLAADALPVELDTVAVEVAALDEAPAAVDGGPRVEEAFVVEDGDVAFFQLELDEHRLVVGELGEAPLRSIEHRQFLRGQLRRVAS
mmetsp:Transcript_5977/g.19419  ORF Transcript_5977/g.19419 Transcript_5977/m.19419 type:complete len:383 (+) Transcript_5977:220-1368(+)